jgi:hypothetical protein
MQARNTTLGMNTAEFTKLVLAIGLLAIVAITLLTASMTRDNSDANLISAAPVAAPITTPNGRFDGKLLDENSNFPSTGVATMSGVAGQTARFWEQNLQFPGAISGRVTSSAVARSREQNEWLPGSSGEGPHDYLPTSQAQQ